VNKAHVLLTGGAGYIGSHVVLALLEADYTPVVLDNLSTGRRDMVAEGAVFIEGDAGDGKLVGDLIDRFGCAGVLHFAGSIQVEESVTQPLAYYDNNVAVSIALLRACQVHAISRFIFSSTAAVYAGLEARPLTEDDEVSPVNPYGRGKLMVEQILRDSHQAHGLEFVTLRYFNVAGADPEKRTGQSGERSTHLIKRACQAAIGLLPAIEVFGTDYETRDGTCVRDYIHVSDLATAHVAAFDHLMFGGAGGTFNCGYGRGSTVLEVLDAVDRQLDRPIKRIMSPRRPGDAASLVADSKRLQSTMEWCPVHDSLDEIVATALAWERHLRERNV
jgi:UDP-glucose 4-epimerase